MTTGLTPLLDSLIAGGYVKLFYDFRRGSLIDSSTSALTLTTPASALLQRNGEFIQGSIAAANTSAYLLTSSLINIFVKLIPYKIPASSTVGIPFCNIWGNNGFQFYTANAAGQAIRFQVGYGTGNILHTGSGTPLTMNSSQTIAAQIKSNDADGIVLYKNGSRLAGTISMAGKTFVGNNNFYRIGNGGSTANLVDGIYQVILVTEGVSLSDTQHLQIADELNNQMSFETQSMIVNGSYPTIGTSVWEARYGLLAGETTMSAGQSLGQLDPLKVSTGTHKATTFLYNGVLAKGIKCVTAGNVILPDPRPTLGTTWAYRYYDDSAATWESRTSATATVALDAVNDIILWATADGRTCLRKY